MINYPKASGDSSSSDPLHLRADSFDCHPERYDIDVLPNSYFKGNVAR